MSSLDYKVKDEYGKTIHKGVKSFSKNQERKALDTYEDIHSVMFGTDFSDKSIEIEDAYELSED
jgi:hypothetical protein|tara:strand:+ start:1081 stop:1272 length:192 start_codon:yes stop_codon:yes gene_type:complete